MVLIKTGGCVVSMKLICSSISRAKISVELQDVGRAEFPPGFCQGDEGVL